ncbi:MAG: hypothetical protein HKN56_03125 [Gammaproteobacteria bacterium]|nr:hypothetical protein [Gammaproteobacteria bacterium]NND53947.1 hypothetical protein [Gammaproteobacteria bacterium]
MLKAAVAGTNRFIVRCSESWWKVLLLFVGFGGSMAGLQMITANFPDLSGGYPPFDMQNDLTPAGIYTQLPTYSEQAFSSYYIFQAIDFAFPLFAGLFLAAVFAFGLRHAAPHWYSVAVARNLLVLILLATLFDYLENLNLLAVVSAWPDQAGTAAQLGVLAKQAKLACMYTANGLTALVLLAAAARWLGRKAGLLER